MAKNRTSGAGIKTQPSKTAVPTGTGVEEMPLGTKIAWYCLHALLFLVPIIVSKLLTLNIGQLPVTYDQFDIVKLVTMRGLTIIALGGWGISLLIRGGKVRFTKIDWLVLAFLAWAAITTVTSIHWPTALFGKYRRFEGLISLVNYAAVYFLTIQLVDRPSRVRSLMRTLFFSGVIVSTYSVLQYLGIEPINYGTLPFEATRAFATYGNPDLLGGFIMFALPISAVLALSEDNVWWRTTYWVGTVLAAIMWITAFTRSAWVGGAVAIPLIVIFAFRQKIRLRTEDWVMSGLAAIAAVVVVVRSLSASSEVLNFLVRVKSIFEFDQGSAVTRFQIWSAAIEATKDRPIFGFGPDTFRLVFPIYKPAAYVAAAGYLSVADNVHNYPLQLTSAIGIPGFLLLYGIFIWVLIDSFKSAFSAESGNARMLYSGIWASAVGYLVHLFFSLSVTGTTVILWVLLGILVAPKARTIELKPLPATGGLLASGAVLVLALLLTAGNVRYAMADHQYLLTRVDIYPPEQDVEAARRAVQLNPYNDMYRAEVGLALLQQAAQLLATADQTDLDTMQQAYRLMQEAEQSLLETIAYIPAEYDNYVFLANLYNQMGAIFDATYYEKALDIARRGIAVERFGPAIRVEYARALTATGDVEAAIKQLRYVIKLDPDYSLAAVELSQVLTEQGDAEGALEVLKTSQTYNAGSAEVAEAIRQLEASVTTP